MNLLKNVVCVKWGEKYSAEYVNKLYSMVQRHLSLPHRFVCLTEDSRGLDSDIQTRPLKRDLKDSYTKFELFEKKLQDILGQVLFLDLDVVIIDSIDDLFLYEPDAKFVSIKDWDVDCINASCMRFEMGKHSYIIDNWFEAIKTKFTIEEYFDPAIGGNKKLYHDLNSFPPAVYRGDQEWTTNQLKEHNVDITYYPSDWIQSYTYGYDMNSKIVVFHGLPKPHEVNDKWVNENWK
jgi:alpha-N-acetylglucosamine transferase